MARILIFCATRKAIEKYDMAGVPIVVGIYPPQHRAETVRKFCEDPNGVLAVDRSMLTGWRAPADTFVTFDASWQYGPADPETIQARGRVL
jgi:hypothetical protein